MIIIRIFSKFSKILSKHQKFRIFELFILMIIAGFMEMLSVSLMIPFITTIINPDKVMSNELVQKILKVSSIQAYSIFLVFLSLLMAAIYLVKNLFLMFQLTVQEKFVRNNQLEMQKNLMKSFMSRPYEFFLTAQSGEIIRIVSTDTSTAFFSLTQLLQVFSELIVTAVLLITIFAIAPVLTVALGAVLLSITLLIYAISKNRLKKIGNRQIKVGADMNQTLLQSIQGIKEIKLMRRESFFQDNYAQSGKLYVRGMYISMLLSLMPRFMLEASAMCSFFIIMAVMIYRGTDIATLLPIISAVAMAAVRLLPSMNRISYSMANLTFSEPAVDKLVENMKYLDYLEEAKAESGMRNGDDKALLGNKSFSKSIQGEDITYKYPTGHTPVLEHAGFEIKKGQSVGIVGASGAGKTTVVDIILGLLKPQDGYVKMDGTDIELDMNNWLSQLGYIPQSIFMLDGSIRDNVAFGLPKENIDDNRVWEALREASLEGFVRSLPDGLETEIGERGVRISGGQRQRIGIARALYGNPEILFFDEATSALDNETEAAIMESINHLHGSKTMIIIAHRLTTIENCDVVYRVADGKMVRER